MNAAAVRNVLMETALVHAAVVYVALVDVVLVDAVRVHAVLVSVAAMYAPLAREPFVGIGLMPYYPRRCCSGEWFFAGETTTRV